MSGVYLQPHALHPGHTSPHGPWLWRRPPALRRLSLKYGWASGSVSCDLWRASARAVFPGKGPAGRAVGPSRETLAHWEKQKQQRGWEGSPLLHNSVSKTPQPQCKENGLPFLLRPSQPGAQPASGSVHNGSSSIVTWLQQPSTPKANRLAWLTTPLQCNYVKHATTWCNTSCHLMCAVFITALFCIIDFY